MESLVKYTNYSSYDPKSCQQETEWFYFDNIIPIHAKEQIIDNNCTVIISVIKPF